MLAPSWAIERPSRRHLGPSLAPTWAHLCPSGTDRDRTWRHVGDNQRDMSIKYENIQKPIEKTTILNDFGAPVGAILAHPGASRGRLGAMLGPAWRQLGPIFAHLGPIVAELGVMLEIIRDRWRSCTKMYKNPLKTNDFERFLSHCRRHLGSSWGI